jgi:hypothetical protein
MRPDRASPGSETFGPLKEATRPTRSGNRGQHLVKEPTEPDGTRRYSCDIANLLRPAKALVVEVDATCLTRKRSPTSPRSTEVAELTELDRTRP